MSLVTPGGNSGTMSHLFHRATMLAVCISAVTSFTCVTDTRVDVIISLPHLLMLRTFHRVLKTNEKQVESIFGNFVKISVFIESRLV